MKKEDGIQFELQYGLSLKAHLARRIWHISMLGSFSYYLVPDVILVIGSFQFTRILALLILYLIIAFMELLRVLGFWTMFLFRDYEKNRLSAPFWFCSAAALLILITPQWFAVPIILGVIFADPIIGELRLRKFRYYPMVGWIACFIPFIIYSYPVPISAVLAAAAVATEIYQKPIIKMKNTLIYRTGFLDDNFTMQIIPALLILVIWYLSNILGIPTLLPDDVEFFRPLY